MENTEPVTYDVASAHIYAQHQWHDEAQIIADDKALAAIAHACTDAIANGVGRAALMTADGEGYSLAVARLGAPFGSPTWRALELPYVGIEYADCVGARLHERWTEQARDKIRLMQTTQSAWWDVLKSIIATSTDPASVEAAAAVLRWSDEMVARAREKAATPDPCCKRGYAGPHCEHGHNLLVDSHHCPICGA